MSLDLNDNLDNGNFLLRGDAKFPEDIKERYNTFKKELYDFSRSLGTSEIKNKEDYDKIVSLLNKYIVAPGFKITKRLSKPVLSEFIKAYSEKLSDYDFVWFKWLLMNAGFLLSTVLTDSLDENSLILPDEFVVKRKTITKEFEENKDNPHAKFKYVKEIEALAKEVLDWFIKEENALGNFINSKTNGNLTHVQEILLGIGLTLNTKGEITDVVTRSLVEGLNQTDYFSNSSQAIAALYAKSSETAKPGYLGKKASNIAEKLKFRDIDCGTKGRLLINTKNKDFLKSFCGLNFSTTKAGQTKEFLQSDVNNHLNQDLYFRTTYHCRANGNYVCRGCYDQDYMRKHKIKDNDNVGLLSSTGMLGSLINLTLKKSHTGISLNLEEVDLTKDLL